MKSSPSIWRYVVNVKLMVKISLIFVAFLENMNFTTAACAVPQNGPGNLLPANKHNDVC